MPAAAMTDAGHELVIDQRGAQLTITVKGRHPYDVAKFLINEVVVAGSCNACDVTFPCGCSEASKVGTDSPHFSTRSCAEFRQRVISVWGPGGRRSLIPIIGMCRTCGERLGPGGCECPKGQRREVYVPDPPADEAIGFDGRLIPLGSRPPEPSEWNPE